MRRIIRLLSLPLVAVAMAFSWVTIVQAQTPPALTQEEEGRIRANCVTIKSTASQLHVSDALLRVNRGQMYESMAGNLMDRFNSRLGSNSLDNKAMLTVTSSYRSTLSDFRTSYINYEQKLSQALKIDCTTQPAQFYNTLQEARELRTEVHKNVQRLHELIDDYRLAVGDFLVNYERVSK